MECALMRRAFYSRSGNPIRVNFRGNGPAGAAWEYHQNATLRSPSPLGGERAGPSPAVAGFGRTGGVRGEPSLQCRLHIEERRFTPHASPLPSEGRILRDAVSRIEPLNRQSDRSGLPLLLTQEGGEGRGEEGFSTVERPSLRLSPHSFLVGRKGSNLATRFMGRETRNPACRTSDACGIVPARERVLPLPEGEGRAFARRSGRRPRRRGEGRRLAGFPAGNTPTEVWRDIKGFEPFIVSRLRLRRRWLTPLAPPSRPPPAATGSGLQGW